MKVLGLPQTLRLSAKISAFSAVKILTATGFDALGVKHDDSNVTETNKSISWFAFIP